MTQISCLIFAIHGQIPDTTAVPFSPSHENPQGLFCLVSDGSEDGQTVAAIKTSGGRTARGRNPAGKINNAIAELYYLSLSEARRRMLVLTSPQFFDILDKHMEGRLAPGIELKLISLPPEIQEKVVDIQARASAEVSKRPTQ